MKDEHSIAVLATLFVIAIAMFVAVGTWKDKMLSKQMDMIEHRMSTRPPICKDGNSADRIMIGPSSIAIRSIRSLSTGEITDRLDSIEDGSVAGCFYDLLVEESDDGSWRVWLRPYVSTMDCPIFRVVMSLPR